MGNGGESKVLNIELTQEKIKSIVNVTYSQPVSYFRKNIKLEMDILKPNREGKFPTVLFVTGGSFAHSYKENYFSAKSIVLVSNLQPVSKSAYRSQGRVLAT